MRSWPWRKGGGQAPAPVVEETVIPGKARQALVDRLSRAAFAERVAFDELLALAKANGAHGPDLEKKLRMGVRYCVDHIKRKRPAPCNRPRLRWVPSLQAWVKPGRVLP